MTDRAAFARDTRANERSFHIDEAELRVRDYPIRTVARGLNNPRGMEKLPDGSLLVAEAGTGTRPDSRVIRLEPCSKGYRIAQVLLDEQPSVSVGPDVKREEIMGAAAIHARASSVFGLFVDSRRRVTRMLEILPEAGRLRCELPGNVMDFAHDPAMSMEYAVSSDRDCIYQLDREGGSIVWVTLSREVTGQHQGQRAVPCALCHDPWSGALLVTLLSGEVHGEHREGDLHPASSTGLNFLHGVARVLAVDPREGTIETHVAGLTLATNAVAHGPHLFVLEGCNAFLDPMVRRSISSGLAMAVFAASPDASCTSTDAAAWPRSWPSSSTCRATC